MIYFPKNINVETNESLTYFLGIIFFFFETLGIIFQNLNFVLKVQLNQTELMDSRD